MFKPLIDSYSAVLKKFKGNEIGATINEEVNIERLKTMYDGYDGDRIIEIRFIDPRRFTVQQRNFIYALIDDIFIDTGMPTDFWKEFFYFRFEGVTGRKISLKDESNTTVSDANVLANIILDFIFEHHIPFKEGYEIYQRIQNITSTNASQKESAVSVAKQELILITLTKRWEDGSAKKLIIQSTHLQHSAGFITRRNTR